MKSSFYSLLSVALLPISLLGANMQIIFLADSKLTSTDKKLKPCTWLKDKAEMSLSGGVNGNINEWNQASFEFIPEKSGMVTISLKGSFKNNKPLDQWQWGVYDNIKVNGNLLPNGGFEDGLKNWKAGTWGKYPMMPQIVEDPMMVRSGKRAVRVWHNGPVSTKFPVKAGEKVLVQLHYMPTNHFNTNEKDFPLSLEKQANRAFADEKAGDGKGGWSDQGPENDLHLFDASRKQIGNVSFTFPKGPNQVAVFDSPHDKTGLKRITLDVPEKAKTQYLYLFHAACWVPKEGVIGELIFTGADGKSEKVPIKIGEDIRDWYNPQNLPNGLVIWKMQTARAAKGLYLSKFKVPVKDLKSIQITGSGKAVWILCGATLSAQDLNLLTANWTPGKEYLPADMAEKNSTLPGSILDLSSSKLKKLDRVVIGKNGNFEFAGELGKSIRFRQLYHYPKSWPMTLKIRKMKREDVHRMIDEYLDEASLRGYNMVRTQTIDRTIFQFGKNNNPDPVTLDAMDYFFYSAKKHNIYINLTMASYNMLSHWEKSPKETSKDRETKILIGDSRIRQMWIELAKNHLCRVNPYTKTMLKDDPILVMVEPYNELAFGLMRTPPDKETAKRVYDKFLDFLEKKLGRKVTDLPKEPIVNQGKYKKEWIEFHYLCVRDTMQFFRNELEKLGVKAPIAQYNLAWLRQYGDVRSEFNDVVIKNAYFAHPSKFSRIGSHCPQDSALLTAGGYFRTSVSARLADRPMVMTEYNHAFWNKYEYEQVLFPAYAAFQGYAGLDMHEVDVLEKNVIRDVFYSSLMDRSHEILTHLLFHRGDVTPSKNLTQLSIPKSSLFAEDALYAISQEQTRGALLTRFAVKYEDTPRPAMIASLPEPKPDVVFPLAGSSKVKQSTMFVVAQDDKSGAFDFEKLVKELKEKKILSASNRTDAVNGIYESDTGELLLNAPQKYMTIKTAKTEVIASEEPTTESLPCMKSVSSSIPATVAISAMDGKTLAGSGKMLLFYLTEITNTGMELSGDRVTLKNLGKAPVLLRTGNLDLKLKLAPNKKYKLYPLRSDGFRREGIPLTTKDGITEIILDTAKLPNGPAFYFELEGK